jgi:hypothetical protein
LCPRWDADSVDRRGARLLDSGFEPGCDAAVKVLRALKTPGLVLATVGLYALHQDVWFWRTARPLLFGFLPIGLAYHVAYCLACSLLMALLVTKAWPAHLEVDASSDPRGPQEP